MLSEHSQRLRLLLAAFVAAVPLHCGQAIAFDSSEHCSTSNLALRIAFDFVSQNLGKSPDLDTIEQQMLGMSKSSAVEETPDAYCFPKKWAKTGAYDFSYGKIVALVDYTINPADLFVSEGSVREPPESPDDLNRTYFRSKTSIGSILDVASHNNADHFQGSVLYLFDHWHTNAMREAARADNARTLFRALANEAIADHFLEDSFAPGHLLTPRSAMSDAVALSWHDAFNDRGRMMAVRHWGRLRQLSEFSLLHSDAYGQEFERIGDALPNATDGDIKRTSLKTALTSLEDAADGKTSDGSCARKSNFVDEITNPILDPRGSHYLKILNFDKTLVNLDRSEADGPGTILLCMHGDGSLDEHDQELSAMVGPQKALMVLIEAKYIEDVLEAFLTAGRGALRGDHPEATSEHGQLGQAEYTWCPMIHSDNANLAKFSWEDACAALLVKAQEECERSSDHENCENVHVLPTAVTDYFAFASSPEPSDPLDGGTRDYRDFLYSAHIGAVSDNQQVVETAGVEVGIGLIDEDSRVLNAKSQKLGDDFTTNCRLQWMLPSCQLEVALFGGYEFNAGHTSRISNAFTFRGAVEIHDLDFQVGPYLNIDEIGDTSLHRWRAGYGARADLGFSLLSFYIALGAEPRFSQPPITVRTLAISAGVSVIVNGRRISNYLHGRFY